MAIQYHMEVKDDILWVTATGKDDNIEQVKSYGLAIIKAAVAAACTRVLCDETDLDYSLGIMDTFESAKFIAETAPKVARVAIVCKPQHVESAHFWETVAVNRGLRIRMCKTVEDAQAWLSQ